VVNKKTDISVFYLGAATVDCLGARNTTSTRDYNIKKWITTSFCLQELYEWNETHECMCISLATNVLMLACYLGN